eukprot:m.156704 g.156704  ORF g.156704 m.156704 type:complete len:481 (-) comp31018_c0_seq1:38-1480(-)
MAELGTVMLPPSPAILIVEPENEEDEEEFHSADESHPKDISEDESLFPTKTRVDSPSPLDPSEPQLTREEAIPKIAELVDFYFGDENFGQDRFLRTKAREDVEGWISFELITSFKRMRKLSEDPQVLIEGVQLATTVVLDDSLTKIKRKHKLPITPKEALYLTAVLENLPKGSTAASVSQMCSDLGFTPTEGLTVYDQQAPLKNPVETLDLTLKLVAEECKTRGSKIRPHPAFDPDAIKPRPSSTMALVIYGSADQCDAACTAISSKRDDWRAGILAAPLCRKDKKARRKKKKGVAPFDSDYSGMSNTEDSAQSDSGDRHSDNRPWPVPPKPLPSCGVRGRQLSRSPLSKAKAMDSPYSSPSQSPVNSPSPSRRNLFGSPRDSRDSPGRPRRFLGEKSLSTGSGPGTPNGRVSPDPRGGGWRARSASPSWRSRLEPKSLLPRSESPGLRDTNKSVTRMPTGPDGSGGFSVGRGRPLSKEV